jgi:ubiquinone biosynthesis protein COQ9
MVNLKVINIIMTLSQAMAVKALIPNVPSAFETLALMVDDIWYMAGDTSTDINWYTKRALLASLYTSTGRYIVNLGHALLACIIY